MYVYGPWVFDLREEAGGAVNDHTEAQRLLEAHDLVGHSVELAEERAVRRLANLGLERAAVDGEGEDVGASALDLEVVLDVLVRNLERGAVGGGRW